MRSLVSSRDELRGRRNLLSIGARSSKKKNGDQERSHRPLLFFLFSTSPFTLRPNLYFSNIQRATDRTSLDTSVQVGLSLGCSSCHLSAEVFFLLNLFVVEGRCEVFGLEDLADLYVGLAFVEHGAALDPLDGLFERLELPEPEAGDQFLAFDERSVNHGGAVLAGEVDAGAFGGGVKTVVA